MSDYDAKRFIEENTSDRREEHVQDKYVQDEHGNTYKVLPEGGYLFVRKPGSSEYAVRNPETGEEEDVHNYATAKSLAKKRGHHIVDRYRGTVSDPNSKSTTTAFYPRSS